MTAPRPRVSIMIPNFNNGRDSSTDGSVDLIKILLDSLERTLQDDPTPLEIIAFDDGSTDDSLATLRTAAAKTWRGGEPFLKLLEAEHCGVLSITANKLVQASSGDILVRLDGDIEVLTPNWAAELVRLFDLGPERLGVIGPKQLGPELNIHAMGDWVLHPKGYHHIAQGFPRDSVRKPIICDHVMGCFYCCKRAVYDDVGGYDEKMLRGQTVDLGMAARLKGWTCMAVPQIEFIHRHGQRVSRATRADSPEGVRWTLDYFEEKWGFNRVAPDLDVVRERYAGTPLLWNAEVFAGPVTGQVQEDTPCDLANSDWPRYTQEEPFQRQINYITQSLQRVVESFGVPESVVVHGSRDGLLPHLLATGGLACHAYESQPGRVELAKKCVKNQTYPGRAPVFESLPAGEPCPMPDASADWYVLYEILGTHKNPVAALRDAARVLRPDGILLVVEPPFIANLPTALDGDWRYRPEEIATQIRSGIQFAVVGRPEPGQTALPQLVVGRKAAAPKPDEQREPVAATA